MKLLLDTHALLWYTLDDPKLSQQAETLILDTANEVYVRKGDKGTQLTR